MQYWYQIGTGTGNFSDFLWYHKNLLPEKVLEPISLKIGIGKIWYQKKVQVSVSEIFCIGIV